MLATYITAHGLGHAARTCDVLAALRLQAPELPITVVSDLPKWFLDSRLPGVPQRRASLDVGMVQRDAVAVDLEATLERVRGLCEGWSRTVADERDWLSQNGVRLVLSDIPAIPLQAAAESSIANAALGNFSWDWIYSAFQDQDPVWARAVTLFRKAYGQCDRLLRYPFHGPMEAFVEVEEIPLVVAPGVDRKSELAEHLGADVEKPWLLFVFANLEFSGAGVERLAGFEEVQFLTTGELNWEGPNVFRLQPAQHCFADLVASAEAVVTKPGFGILSDCVANSTPLVYVEREHFLESLVMEEATRRHTSCFHLPLAELYEGRLEPVLEALGAGLAAPLEPVGFDGAEVVAARLLELYG